MKKVKKVKALSEKELKDILGGQKVGGGAMPVCNDGVDCTSEACGGGTTTDTYE